MESFLTGESRVNREVSSLITIDAVLKGIRRYAFLSRSLKRVGLEWKLGKGGGGEYSGDGS